MSAGSAPTVPPEQFTVGTLDIYRTAGTSADPLLAAQMLPGVVKADEGAGLFVRGGDVEETRTFLDKAVLDHPYRYESVNGGLFGTVPPFLITGLSLSTGGFPARYGDALSAVLELRGLERPTSPATLVTLGLAAASAQVSLPLGDRAGFRLAGNQSFTNLLFAVNRSEQRFARPPSGRDLSLAAYWESGRVGRLQSFFFRGSERVGVEVEEEAFRGELESDSDGDLFSIRWDRLVARRWLAELTLSQSRHRQDLEVGAVQLASQDRGRRARFDVSGPFGRWLVRSGGEWEARVETLRGTTAHRGGDFAGHSGLRDWDLDFRSTRYGSYLELERRLSRVELNLGMRADFYPAFGRWARDPRASARVHLGGRHSLRLAWGLYHQAPSAGYLDADWGNKALGLMEARHLVLGYGLGDEEDRFQVRVETYDKRYRGLPVEEPVMNFVDGGIGSARGIDLFVRASGGDAWDAWASYGFLRARRRYTRLGDFGRYPTPSEPVRPDFEIPHSFQLAARRALAPSVTLSASFRLASGKPFTPIVAAEEREDVLVPIYGDFNSEGYPIYHRLDLAMSHIRPVGESTAAVVFIGVGNLLDRPNVFGYAYSADFTTRRPRRSSWGRTIYFGVSFQR